MTAAHEPNEIDGPHEGPIKTPKQLILAVLYAFVVPIFGIILLVMYVTTETRPSAGSDARAPKSIAERIRPVGTVEIKDATDIASLKTGEQVYAAQCTACHATGALNAPKLGDARRLGAAHQVRLRRTCSTRRSPARARCRRRAAATSPTSRSPARWSTWPTRAAPSSPSRRRRSLAPRLRQRRPPLPRPRPPVAAAPRHAGRRPRRRRRAAAPAVAETAAAAMPRPLHPGVQRLPRRGRGRRAEARRQGRLGAAPRPGHRRAACRPSSRARARCRRAAARPRTTPRSRPSSPGWSARPSSPAPRHESAGLAPAFSWPPRRQPAARGACCIRAAVSFVGQAGRGARSASAVVTTTRSVS